MKLFDSTFGLLENSLHLSQTRNRLISNNISNVDTPNYKAQGVSFKSMLESEKGKLEAKRTDHRHFSFSDNQNDLFITTKRNTTYNNNGNNVDIDKEMSDLAKNQIFYNSLVERVNGKFNTLRTVVRGGNG